MILKFIEWYSNGGGYQINCFNNIANLQIFMKNCPHYWEAPVFLLFGSEPANGRLQFIIVDVDVAAGSSKRLDDKSAQP